MRKANIDYPNTEGNGQSISIVVIVVICSISLVNGKGRVV